MASINLRIKNTFEPEHPGTLISKNYISKDSKVEIVTGSHKVIYVDIHDPLMVGQVGFDYDIMALFKKYHISYILKATNANTITIVIWEKDLNKELIDELKQKYYQVVTNPCAIISLIGTNIAKPGIFAKVTKALADNQINIEAMSQTVMQVNMQLIIERNDFEKAIKVLNEAVCVRG